MHADLMKQPLNNPLGLSLNNKMTLSSSRQIPILTNNTTRPLSKERGTSSTTQQQHIRRRQLATEPPALGITTLKAYYYFIQALGKSDNSGCKHPQPSFTATCPTGAFIVSQSSKSVWQSRLDCTQRSPTSIYCTPKQITEDNHQEIDFDDLNGVTIACYGSFNTEGDSEDEGFDPWADLLVSVQVEPGSYYCDKALEVKTIPHPTVITGGSVYQTVAIQKQCYASEADNSWVFVQPTCSRVSTPTSVNSPRGAATDLLQTTEVQVVYHEDDDTGLDDFAETLDKYTATVFHCEMQEGCQAEYSCSPRCAGMDSCLVNLPGFITNSTAAFGPIPTNGCMPRDFVMDLDQGAPCEFNLMCTSGVCNDGVCVVERLPDLAVCEEGVDCTSQACGRHPLNETTPISPSDIPQKTCCPSGETFGYQGESFCTSSQPIGAACHEDSMCVSDICVFNTCRESLLAASMECEEDSDCLGGVCGKYHTNNDAHICCPTGASLHLGDGPWCSERAAGDACENNANSICKSNICVEGYCQGIEQDVGAVCDNHNDCKNSACALESPDVNANYICCPTGDYIFVAPVEDFTSRSPNHEDPYPNSWRVCTGQPEGAYCSEDQDLDDLCESGFCIDGTCRSSRLAIGDDCLKDEDCENVVCAWSSLNQDGDSKICCPSNDHKHVYVPFTDTSGELVDVCTGQPVGAPCGDHNIHVLCDSGLCVDSFCHEAASGP